MTLALTIPHDPTPKPRMTQRDQWKQRPAVLRYRSFCDDARTAARRAGFTMPAAGAHLAFYVPMPKSWSKKKRAEMNGHPHQQRPDIDNYVKAVLDALCEDDSHIWQLSSEKRWATVGRVEIEIVPAREQAA